MRNLLKGIAVLVLASQVYAAERATRLPPAADLLFTSGRDGNSEIFLLSAGATEWRNLSQHEASDNWPVWSADGRRIAFQSKRSGNLDIWTMNADGSDQRQLTDHPEPDYLPAWSPDGKHLVFTSWRTESESEARAPHIYIMRADGSDERRLIAQSTNTSAGAVYSPDGRSLLYSRQTEGEGADLFLADADGKNERQLTFDSAADIYNGSGEFSPDGRWIAFYSDDNEHARLQIIDLRGKRRRSILAEGKNWYPRWSADGRWLVYTAPAAGGVEGNTDVLAVPIKGKPTPILLVSDEARDLEASWRPSRGQSGAH